MKFPYRMTCLGILIALVSACQQTVAPVEQVQKMQTKNKAQATTVKKSDKVSVERRQATSQYVCKGDTLIKISRVKAKKNTKNNSIKSILLSFNGAEHRLSPAVAKEGKKFSNIRWSWIEYRDGHAELSENGGKTLAKDCRLK